MKVTPIPLPLKILWSGITLRSPLSVVSDSFGHENEVDISKSSEVKTSATGSKVAPRSMGSLFSPMEKTKKAQKEVYPFYIRGAKQGDKTICAVHLGVRSVVDVIWLGGRGWLGNVKENAKRCKTHFYHSFKDSNPSQVLLHDVPQRGDGTVWGR